MRYFIDKSILILIVAAIAILFLKQPTIEEMEKELEQNKSSDE